MCEILIIVATLLQKPGLRAYIETDPCLKYRNKAKKENTEERGSNIKEKLGALT